MNIRACYGYIELVRVGVWSYCGCCTPRGLSMVFPAFSWVFVVVSGGLQYSLGSHWDCDVPCPRKDESLNTQTGILVTHPIF